MRSKLAQWNEGFSKTLLHLRIKKTDSHNMKKNEEYVNNKGRDWLVFAVSTVAMVALLIWMPEWIWVAWPFQFTALAGALGRL
jgi:hypothetical protein